ncbi:uncharacterized protein LOC141696485 [Apium graveolens]|uniref:uncharacterized protein LOC141696485 n=1 Tax=Apium graveolens TaxID=4045 RepID=UPI003D7962B2
MEVEDPRDFDFDLDPRIPMPAEKTGLAEDTVFVPVDKNDPSKVLKVGFHLSYEMRERLTRFLIKNLDVFAWSHSDMVGIDLRVMCHRLNIFPNCTGIRQKRRPVSGEREIALKEEVDQLLEVGLIKESFYPEWLANSVLVKKPNRKWKDVYITGRIVALNRFVSKLSDRCKEFFRAIKLAGKDFVWTPECEEAFRRIKEQLGNPPMLSKPLDGESLILYLAVSEYSISAVLIREEDAQQSPVYYVSKRLHDVETHYTSMEKLVYALILASRKLHPYFQAHRIEVRTVYPLRKVLHKPESSGRMFKWAVELGQFDLDYMPRTTIKGQALADFLLEFDYAVDDKALLVMHPPRTEESLEEFPHPWWILHVDGAANNGGAGAGIVLVSPEGHHLMSVIHFKFYVTNNDAKYEALINGLKIALEMGVRNLIAKSDSELVVNQLNEGFQARGPWMELYLRCM